MSTYPVGARATSQMIQPILDWMSEKGYLSAPLTFDEQAGAYVPSKVLPAFGPSVARSSARHVRWLLRLPIKEVVPMRICVFCSSAEGLPDAYVDAAIHLGTLIGAHGHELVFGGYDDGLMGAVAFGAKRAGARVTGVLPAREGDLPGRVSFPCDELVEARGLSQRKVEMMRLADAFVALPGSYGTLDELYEVLAAEKLAGAGRPDDGAGECGAGTGKARCGQPPRSSAHPARRPARRGRVLRATRRAASAHGGRWVHGFRLARHVRELLDGR